MIGAWPFSRLKCSIPSTDRNLSPTVSLQGHLRVVFSGRAHDPKMVHRFKQTFMDFFTIRPSAGVKMRSFDEEFYKEQFHYKYAYWNATNHTQFDKTVFWIHDPKLKRFSGRNNGFAFQLRVVDSKNCFIKLRTIYGISVSILIMELFLIKFLIKWAYLHACTWSDCEEINESLFESMRHFRVVGTTRKYDPKVSCEWKYCTPTRQKFT